MNANQWWKYRAELVNPAHLPLHHGQGTAFDSKVDLSLKQGMLFKGCWDGHSFFENR